MKDWQKGVLGFLAARHLTKESREAARRRIARDEEQEFMEAQAELDQIPGMLYLRILIGLVVATTLFGWMSGWWFTGTWGLHVLLRFIISVAMFGFAFTFGPQVLGGIICLAIFFGIVYLVVVSCESGH